MRPALQEDLVLQLDGYAKFFTLHSQSKLIPSAHEVNLTVYASQLTALTGPTGAGKSSVLKGIFRTYLPSAGRILYRARNGNVIDMARAEEYQVLELRRAEISCVTQFLHCLPRQAALDVVAKPLCLLGATREIARERAGQILTQLNLPERLWSVSPANFSGGEKQRVNLARGLVTSPRLILLDEPTASLDPATAELVLELITQVKRRGAAILAIFHDPEITRRLADSVIELQPASSIEEIIKDGHEFNLSHAR